MPRLVKVEGLVVRYGEFTAVSGVSFALGEGEILGIVGESGSGKSTIAKALMGLERATAGRIACRRDEMQMIFQDAVGSLNPRMTVESALAETLKVRGRTAKDRIPARIDELLALVGLSPAVRSQYPRELSGGQCQRVSIARALACEPRVLIADEPVSALDVSVQARVLNLLRDLRRSLGLAILLIAHDLAVVKNVCDRVAVMERGVFVDFGDAESVFTQPKSEYTRRLLSAVPSLVSCIVAAAPSPPTISDKPALRERMRALRGGVTSDERERASRALCERLLERDDIRRAIAGRRPIAVYLASGRELDLAHFISCAGDRGARLVAPRWNGSEYEMAVLSSLTEGPHHILEPVASAERVDGAEVAVWLVPGLAFTADGIRLGYGGGWYDRLLAHASPSSSLLGIAYPFQIVESLPCEPHDQSLTEIVAAAPSPPTSLRSGISAENRRSRFEGSRRPSALAADPTHYDHPHH